MKPFRTSATMSAEEKRFNYCLSRSRMVVERAFGHLKGRWRVLLKTMEMHISRAPSIFLACAVLHNMCELNREDFIEQWVDEVRREEEGMRRQQPPRPVLEDRQAGMAARPRDIRETLCQYMSQQQ